MCVIYLAYEQHPEYPLILLANRDEFYERPTAPAGFWTDFPQIYGGRDLVRGGTWLGVAKPGFTRRVKPGFVSRAAARPGSG